MLYTELTCRAFALVVCVLRNLQVNACPDNQLQTFMNSIWI